MQVEYKFLHSIFEWLFTLSKYPLFTVQKTHKNKTHKCIYAVVVDD